MASCPDFAYKTEKAHAHRIRTQKTRLNFKRLLTCLKTKFALLHFDQNFSLKNFFQPSIFEKKPQSNKKWMQIRLLLNNPLTR